MKLIGLDISSASTGVAIGSGDETPRTFLASFSGASRGHVGASYAKWLRELLIVEKPDVVAYEAPLMASAAKGSADTLYLLMGLAFQTEVICAIREVPAYAAQVQSWRKVFLGHGRPHDPKRAAVQICARLGWDVGGSHDRADAIGVWVWGHYNYGDRQAIQRALSGSAMRFFRSAEAVHA